MALNDIRPTYLILNYTSAYGTHKHTFPTVPVENVGQPLFPQGQFTNGSGDPIGSGAGEVVSIVEGLVNVLRAAHRSTTTYTSWELWQVPNVSAWNEGTDTEQAADPIAGGSFTGKVGTAQSNAWAKATEVTMTFRGPNRALLMPNLLDVPVSSFDKNGLMGPLGYDPIRDYFLSANSPVITREGSRVNAFLQQSADLSKKLREAYGMV